MREKLLSPWLTVRVQFVLTALFVVAGFSKIADPPGFAHEIHNYRIFPAAAVNLVALVLPWLEVVTGVALFFGIFRRTAAQIFGVLLLVFIVAIGVNLARGRPVDCGCFGTAKVQKTDTERLADMKWVIVRDVGMLLLVAQILAATRVGSGLNSSEFQPR
ncbi:MAG: MauE/DoxX family redox-associated membrane protein [Thermoanaerobaculia bacterium]